jgi:hypothetical protein
VNRDTAVSPPGDCAGQLRAQYAATLSRGDDAAGPHAYLVPRYPDGAGIAEVNRIMMAVLRVLTLGKWRAEGGRAPAPTSGRKVWRITADKPGGEWVDGHSATPPPHDGRSTLPMDSWATSSMDLLDGVQIVEHTDSQLPDDLRAPIDRTRPGGAPH